MNDKFKALPKEEQKRILNSAFNVFTDTPYHQASTNAIVRDAKISKGKLFYYFTDKMTLFTALIDVGMRYIKETFIDRLDLDEPDFLKRYQIIASIKQKAHQAEPYLFAFMGYVYLHEADRIEPNTLEKIRHYQSVMNTQLTKDVDQRLFRDDIDAQTVMTLLTYSLKGYEQELIETIKHSHIGQTQPQTYYDDYNRFIKTLRQIYYK